MAKRKRRAFTQEFKAGAVRLVQESGKSVPTVARELDLTETAWVRKLRSLVDGSFVAEMNLGEPVC
jgi:transposase-like protein